MGEANIVGSAAAVVDIVELETAEVDIVELVAAEMDVVDLVAVKDGDDEQLVEEGGDGADGLAFGDGLPFGGDDGGDGLPEVLDWS